MKKKGTQICSNEATANFRIRPLRVRASTRPPTGPDRKRELFCVYDGAVRSECLASSRPFAWRLRGLTRARHRAPAIERYLLVQAATFLSPMSALQSITDSSQTSRRVRKPSHKLRSNRPNRPYPL